MGSQHGICGTNYNSEIPPPPPLIPDMYWTWFDPNGPYTIYLIFTKQMDESYEPTYEDFSIYRNGVLIEHATGFWSNSTTYEVPLGFLEPKPTTVETERAAATPEFKALDGQIVSTWPRQTIPEH